jgi:amidase
MQRGNIVKFELPRVAQLKEIGTDLGFTLEDDYAEQVLTFMAPFSEAFNALEGLPDHLPVVKYPRTAGYKPTGDENKYGAWYVKTTIKGRAAGGSQTRRSRLRIRYVWPGCP